VQPKTRNPLWQIKKGGIDDTIGWQWPIYTHVQLCQGTGV